MVQRRNYGSRKQYSYSRDLYNRSSGFEAAKKHISEAADLSRELGGTDRDVKDYFYGLNSAQLKSFLDDYGRKYGEDKRQYAEEAFPQWKSGSRKMSGLVAGRLFSLLPRHMPISKKFQLIESLWKFSGPTSRKKLYVGPDASAEELTTLIRTHLHETVRAYSIRDTITKRADWLAENDAILCQKLRNHFLSLEKEQLATLSSERVKVILEQIRKKEVPHQTVTQVFNIGKHQVEIQFNPNFRGVSGQEPKPIKKSPLSPGGEPKLCDSDKSSVWCWIIFLSLIFIIIAAKS